MTDIIVSISVTLITALAGMLAHELKCYLVAKGGEKAIKIVEILANNAVHAVEQVSAETGYKGDEKLSQAKRSIIRELKKYNLMMSEHDLDMFVESAVKKMNDEWR